MSQSKKMSLVETLFNVAVGYLISLLTQIFIFPHYGIIIPLHDNITIGAIFTVVSIVRSYSLRRFFNWHHTRRYNIWLADQARAAVDRDWKNTKGYSIRSAGS